MFQNRLILGHFQHVSRDVQKRSTPGLPYPVPEILFATGRLVHRGSTYVATKCTDLLKAFRSVFWAVMLVKCAGVVLLVVCRLA